MVKVVEVRMVSDSEMTVVVLEEDVQKVICGYAWQGFEEKQSFMMK